MSVLACDRNGCTNIMCDRYSTQYGYICDECFDELVDSNLSFAKFMDSKKGSLEKDQDRFDYCAMEFVNPKEDGK